MDIQGFDVTKSGRLIRSPHHNFACLTKDIPLGLHVEKLTPRPRQYVGRLQSLHVYNNTIMSKPHIERCNVPYAKMQTIIVGN